MGDEKIRCSRDKKKTICDMAGLSGSNTIYKNLRPKQILKSEKKVTKVTEAVENEYIYPFGLHLEKNGLAHLLWNISNREDQRQSTKSAKERKRTS